MKEIRLEARSDGSGRPFQSLAPLYEKLFWPVEVFLFGSVRSVSVLLRLYEGLVEFATNRSERYCGVSRINDLNTITRDSNCIISLIVFQPKLSNNGLLGASSLLPVMIRVARF